MRHSHSEESRLKNRLAHLGRTPWNKGLTKDTDARVAKYAITKQGQRHDYHSSSEFQNGRHAPVVKEEFRAKMSAIAKARWATRYDKLIVSSLCNLEKYNSLPLELRATQSRKVWANSQFREKILRNRSPTSIELLAQQSLVLRRIGFFTHKRIEDLVSPDQVLSDYKIAIFEDGCYYHGCSIHNDGQYNIRNDKQSPISMIREKDKAITETLEQLGWAVIRAWHHEFKGDEDVVGKRVDEAIHQVHQKADTNITLEGVLR